MLMKRTYRIFLLGIIAFCLYGSWAFYINSDFGNHIAFRSAIAQGMLSFSVTTMMSYAMEFFFKRITWRYIRFFFTAYFPLICVLYFMAFVHWMIGTPNIIETITPSIIVGTLYCTSYTIGLSRGSKRKLALRILIFLSCMCALLSVGFAFLKKETKSQLHGIVYVKGLTGPVFIQRDKNGVPHIIAEKNDQDAFFALGFVHAQDRLWQMEFQNHVLKGTLSTIFGKATIKQDEFLRTWGFYRAAKAAWPALDAHTHKMIESYTDGVNAEIKQGHLPLQCILLGYRPSNWSVYDSIGWQKMMAWELQFTWQQKIKDYLIAQQYGEKKISYYMPPYPASAPTTIENNAIVQRNDTQEASRHSNNFLSSTNNFAEKISVATPLSKILGTLNFPGKGSNAWVVSGKLTRSGMPLLANDVHLPLTSPDPFYLVSLKGPHIDVTGASIPGLPGVVIGHNQHIAWGVTDGYNDAQDLFIIPSSAHLSVQNTVINVKNGKSINFPIEISDHGPIVSSVVPQMAHLPIKLAIQWPALEGHDTTIQSFLKLQYATNWRGFVNALQDFVSPTQNFVYADTAGNIGFYYPGKLPIRNGFSGVLPVNDSQHWRGFIPFDQLPQSYNPSDGFIATANNRVAPASYPYLINSRWSVPPYRVERIRYLLTHSGKITQKACEQFQQDTMSYFWEDLKSVLLHTKPRDAQSQQALLLLSRWDGKFRMNSKSATIFAYWIQQFQVLWPNSLAFGDKWLEPLYLKNVLQQPTEMAFLSKSLSLAMQTLIANRGDNPNNWMWGNTHHAVFNELGLGLSKMVSWIWKENLMTPGGDYTLDVGTYDPKNFTQIAGPTYRQVINLKNFDESTYMLPLGESENVFSPFYRNLLLKWRDVSYIAIPQVQSGCDPKLANCLELLPVRGD